MADRLRALGVEVEIVAEPFSQEVEALNVEKVVLSGTYYEGVSFPLLLLDSEACVRG